MTRRCRLFSALLAVFALLFAQLMVSAHACEVLQAPTGSEVNAHSSACHEMAPADAAPWSDNLCAGHCQYGDASVDNAPPAPAVDAGGPVLRLDSLADAVAPAAGRLAWRYAPAAAPPPPAILFGVLRI